MLAQTNVRLAARWRDVDLTLDLMNVFDRETATNLSEIYAGQGARPIRHGTSEDLVFLKSSDDSPVPAIRRTAYRLPVAFQPPFSFALGIRKAF